MAGNEWSQPACNLPGSCSMAAGSVNTHGSTQPEAGRPRARRAIPWRRRPDTSGNAGYGSVVGNDRVAAVFATRHMTAERRRAAGLDRTHHLDLVEADVPRIGTTPCRPVVAEDSPTNPRAQSSCTTCHGRLADGRHRCAERPWIRRYRAAWQHDDERNHPSLSDWRTVGHQLSSFSSRANKAPIQGPGRERNCLGYYFG